MAEDVGRYSPEYNPFPPRLPEPAATAVVDEAEPAQAKRRRWRLRAPGSADHARQSAYRLRFVVTYFLLAIVAGGAIGGLIVVLDRPAAKPPAAWSSFTPKGTLTARLFQIADTIPRRYRGGNGKQLVGATVSAPQQQISPDQGQSFVTLPISRIEIYDRGNITTATASGSVQFTLCGDGSQCELKTGRPSQARYYLLEREALELSLYTLRYVQGLDSVTVLLPPSRRLQDLATGGGQLRQTAVFLQRKDVERELSRPLSYTLDPKTPRVGKMSARDLKAVRQISIPHTYDWIVGQAQDGAFVRQLQPAG